MSKRSVFTNRRKPTSSSRKPPSDPSVPLPPRKQSSVPRKKDVFTLLNLNPVGEECRREESKPEYDDKAVLNALRRCGRPDDLARTKFAFTAWGTATLYPLSMAVALCASVDVVRLLYDSYPAAIEDKDCRGWTPLHLACLYKAPFEVALFLTEKYPLAMKMKGWNGDTPLHLACRIGSRLDLVEMLAERHPEIMGTENLYGNTPLALAEKSQSRDVITLMNTLQTLLRLNPSDTEVESILMERSGEMWSSSVAPILHLRTMVLQRMGLHHTVMPTLLGRVGREGRLQTVFQIVRETMDILEFAGRSPNKGYHRAFVVV